MFRLLLAVVLLSSAVIPLEGFAQRPRTRTPAYGDAERTAILSALSDRIVTETHESRVRFIVHHLKVNDGWAFIWVTPRDGDDRPMQYLEANCARQNQDVVALLSGERRNWVVRALDICLTDATYLEWTRQFDFSTAILRPDSGEIPHAAAATAAAAPTGSPSPAADGTRDYYPLEANLRWEYATTTTFDDGSVEEGSMVVQVVGVGRIGGREYYRVSTTILGGEIETDELFVRRAGDSILVRRAVGPERLAEQLPFRVGNGWSSGTPDNAAAYQVEALEDVTVSGRTYRDCFRVRLTEVEDVALAHYCPDVGIVQRIVEVGNVHERQVLVRFFDPSS